MTAPCCCLEVCCKIHFMVHWRLWSELWLCHSSKGWMLCGDPFCSTDQGVRVRRLRGGFTAPQQGPSVVECPGCKPATQAPFISVEILEALCYAAVPAWNGNMSSGSCRVKCCSIEITPFLCHVLLFSDNILSIYPDFQPWKTLFLLVNMALLSNPAIS